MKTLFIVDHYVPFPQSEYGGVWNVLIDTDEECFDLITGEDSDTYPEFYSVLRENISKNINTPLHPGRIRNCYFVPHLNSYVKLFNRVSSDRSSKNG